MNSLDIINIKELYELIELYKKSTINGEKTELIISYPFENGVYDYSKRIITLSLVGGYSRDRDSFIVDSNDFEKYILPNLVEYYCSGDSLSDWDKTYVAPTNIYKGVNETVSGNVLYVEEKEDIYDSLKYERVLEKEEFTSDDKVWDEIINYTKERRKTKDYYSSANFTYREIGSIFNFIERLSEDEKINIGKNKKSKENNINYVSSLFEDKEKTLSLGLNEELYNKIVSTDTVRQLALFAGFEKRLRNRIDVNSSIIKDRIKFAIDELDKVDYYDLKNASVKSFKTKDFLTSKPLAIIKLKHNCESKLYDYETSLNYQKYCDEILGYLERNAKRNRKDLLSKVEKNVEFKRYNNVVVDSYDELWDAVSLVVGARVNDERYEIIVDDNKENGNKIVKVSLISNLVKTDTFIFEFTDQERLNEELMKIQSNIAKIDPSFDTIIRFTNNKKVVSEKSIDNNLNNIKNIELNKINGSVLKNDSRMLKRNNNIINKLIKINSRIYNNNGKIEKNNLNIINPSDESNKLNENSYNKEDNKKIEKKDLEKIEKFFSDYMLEKEHKEKQSEFVDIPFMNLSISTYEILINKYKDNLFELYQKNQLPKDEKEVIDSIKSLKDKLEIYYNETVDRSASLIEEEIRRLANCEISLATIYRLESSYDKEKTFNNTPSGLLKKKIYQMEYEKNDKYIDDIVDEYINKYRVILQKYGNGNDKYDEKELIGDKNTLLQVITFKMKLKDAYDSLINKENLTNSDLATLARYERVLYDIYEIDSKYQENIEEKINELKNQEQFLTPSSRIYLSSLEKEFNSKKVIKEDNKSEYLFEIIKKDENNEKNEDESEIVKKAYYKSLENSSLTRPLNINIVFDKNDKDKVELIISNFNDKESDIAYKKEMDREKIKELIPLLCELFNESHLEYAFKYNIADTEDICLLGFTNDKKTFKISYADDELIDYAKDLLESGLNKEEKIKK